jgi:hypothetical protein
MGSLLCFGVTLAGMAFGAPDGLEGRFGGPACDLVEGLPGKGDPLTKSAAFAAGLAKSADPSASPKELQRAHESLERAVEKLFAEARRLFHPKGSKSFKPAVAGRFLARHVLVANPVLAVAQDGFEPVSSLRAALVRTACGGGLAARAVAWARRPGETTPFNGLAALLLAEAGREAEARELLPWIPEDGFVSPYARADLAAEPAERTRLHAIAKRRATTAAERLAIQAQAARLGL